MIKKNLIKPLSQLTLALVAMLVIASPAYAIYDPVAQKDCTSTSTEAVCLMRTTTPPAATIAMADILSVAKAIATSNLPLNLKLELLKTLVSGVTDDNDEDDDKDDEVDTTKSNTYSFNGGTATFGEGKYSFNLGCNTIAGTYTQDGEDITINAGASTLMACADDLMKKDATLIADLAKVTEIEIENGNIILSGDKVELKLIKK